MIYNFLLVYWKYCYKIKVFVFWMIFDLDMDIFFYKIKYIWYSKNLFFFIEGFDWFGGFFGCEDGLGGFEFVVFVIVLRGYIVYWLDSFFDKVFGLGVNLFIGDCFGFILRI